MSNKNCVVIIHRFRCTTIETGDFPEKRLMKIIVMFFISLKLSLLLLSYYP